jgi:UPF0755 protein
MEDKKEIEIKKGIFSFKLKYFFNIFFILVIFFILIYYSFSAPINSFSQQNIIIHLAPNQTLNSLAFDLKNKNIIKSPFFLKFFIFLSKAEKKVLPGDYLIKRNSPVFKIAWQLAKGDHKVDKIKITLREGLTNEEIANILADKLVLFRKDIFLSSEKAKQGFLFPDTYFFFPMTSTQEVLDQIFFNFQNQIRKIENQIENLNYSLNEIIIMASIIEKEAKGSDDASLISGILWKRLEIGMLLQADAAPITYQEKGLPDLPICNPGLNSILAAIKPIASPYLYYLHDKNGQIYFAKNYEEHKRNINKYLR